MSTRVAFFARINRRHQELFEDAVAQRDFAADLFKLVENQSTRAPAKGRMWSAGDLEVDPSGTFVTGILGFEDDQTLVTFDPDAFSWTKGDRSDVVGATDETMVPFAIDARDGRQFVAFTTTRRIKATTFCDALSAVFTEASDAEGWQGLVWEVDLITDTTELDAFLVENPFLTMVQRTVKRPNPRGEYLEDDLARMNTLSAQTLSEVYRIRRKTRLSEEATELIKAGLSEGFTEVRLESNSDGVSVQFDSKKRRKKTVIDDFRGMIKERGTELLSQALQGLPGGSKGPEQVALIEESEGGDTPQ